MNLRDLRIPLLLSVTVGIGYALCTAVFAAFPGMAANFMTALFHGMDFRLLQVADVFSVGSFAYALAILVAWTFMLGWIYTVLSAAFGPRRL